MLVFKISAVTITALLLADMHAPQNHDNHSLTEGNFGLLGRWAVDCNELASTTNPHVTFDYNTSNELIYTLYRQTGGGYETHPPAPAAQNWPTGIDATFRQGYGFAELLAGQEDLAAEP